MRTANAHAPGFIERAAAVAVAALLSSGSCAGAQAAETGTADDAELDLPPREQIEAHKTYDRGPELQQTAGGGLIVNAFIMEGPVRVEILDRHSGELVMEKEERSLFPFEVARSDLGVDASQVLVRIYVNDELAHELDLLPEP